MEILDLKCTVTQTKILPEGLNSGFELTGEKISELKDSRTLLKPQQETKQRQKKHSKK